MLYCNYCAYYQHMLQRHVAGTKEEKIDPATSLLARSHDNLRHGQNDVCMAHACLAAFKGERASPEPTCACLLATLGATHLAVASPLSCLYSCSCIPCLPHGPRLPTAWAALASSSTEVAKHVGPLERREVVHAVAPCVKVP